MKKLLILLFLFVSAANLNAKINFDIKTGVFYSTPMTPDINQSVYDSYCTAEIDERFRLIEKGYSVFEVNRILLSALDQAIKDNTQYRSTFIRLKQDLKVGFVKELCINWFILWLNYFFGS